MADKGNIRLSILGGDRGPWTGCPVTVKLVDPFSQTGIILKRHTTKQGVNQVLFQGVPADRGQNYSVLATAKDHRDAGIYPVHPVAGEEVNAAAMLIRKQPVLRLGEFSFDALRNASPQFHQALLAAGITEQEFRALPPEKIAGTLNFEAKLRHTSLAGTRAVDLVARIGSPEPRIAGTDALFPDRIFAFTNPAMPRLVRQDIEQSGGKSFRELLAFENEVFHRGFPVSFKQRVSFGSLQLSFAERPGDNNLLAADIDIDLATDIGHFGEVIKNHLTKQKTDPFTVYRLLFDQQIFPLYSLEAGEAAEAAPGG